MYYSILALVCLCLSQVQWAQALAVNSNSQTHEHTVYLVRHFEKQMATDSLNKDVSLTVEGKRYALALQQALAGTNITEVYSSPYKRTLESAQATANAFNVDVQEYNPRKLSSIATHAINSNKNMLIVGHSNTTPELFAQLGCYKLNISERDYNQVYVVKFTPAASATNQSNHALVSENQRDVTCSEFSLSLASH
jgi:broad specificity phosphatase PhoE